jgi:hypothetical protein
MHVSLPCSLDAFGEQGHGQEGEGGARVPKEEGSGDGGGGEYRRVVGAPVCVLVLMFWVWFLVGGLGWGGRSI